MLFDEDYFNAGQTGYKDYKDYPHFYQRAEWLYDYYTTNGLTGKVFILGCAYGYTLKHLIEDFGVPSTKVRGVEFSQYAYNQCLNNGLEDYVTYIDVKDYDFSQELDLDIAVSWNLLDCLPNETVAEGIITKLNQSFSRQMHVLCIADDDTNSQLYIDEGYFIQNRSWWANRMAKGTVMVEYETNKVWVHRDIGWVQESGWRIPTCWGRVSN